MKIKYVNTVVTCLFVCLLLSACDEGPAVRPAKPATSSKPAIIPVSTDAAEAKDVEVVYVYDPRGTRDPFKNPFGTLTESPVITDTPLTPLQKYDLSQLRVIGVIIGKGDPKAMVVAPSNKSFVLKKGTKIGKNNGTVISISTDVILVEEQYLDFAGAIQSTMQEIRLPKQGGVK